MAKNNFLVLIRKRIEEIHREYNALKSAYETLDKVSGLRGRKVVLPELSDMISDGEAGQKEKKGKRGRPRKKVDVPSVNENSQSKKGKGKRGRKKGSVNKAKESIAIVLTKPAKIADKPAKGASLTETPKKKSPGRPKLNKGKSKSSNSKSVNAVSEKNKPSKSKKTNASAKKNKRSRVPNLAGRISDIIKTSNRFVTNAEITDKLASTYPSKDRNQLSKYLSVVLSQMKGRKEAAVIVKDHKGNRMRSGLWGLPNWFENGRPKNEYLK